MAERLLAVAAPSSIAPGGLTEFARRAEECGYDEIWVTDEYYSSGPFTQVAAILGATERIGVGVGVVASATRHPATIAMEAAAIAGIWPGRLRLGIGVGHGPRLEQMGLDPLVSSRDSTAAIDSVRALLAGESITFVPGGDEVALRHPPSVVPSVLVAAVGPVGLRAAAMRADGAVYSWMSGPNYVRWAAGQLTAAGSGTFGAVIAMTVIDADGGVARGRALPMVTPMAQRGHERIVAAAGIDRSSGPVELSDDQLAQLAVVGSPVECAARVAALWSAGADVVVLYPGSSADAAALVGGLGADLLAACDRSCSGV